MSYKKLECCRICGNKHLVEVLDLGEQTLSGVFPRNPDQEITRGPLRLVKCAGDNQVCGLLQLAHSYDLNEMYGDNYGYRSGLNQSMVKHLHKKIDRILSFLDKSGTPLVLDIGSNDGTTLAAYPSSFIRVGIDPTASKFREYYPDGVHVIADFFSAEKFFRMFPGRKARAVTSFSMFYDLERPMDFIKEVAQILEPQGIWVFEQSYMPLMLERNSFDTICHEHLEYYAFKQIHYMLERNQLKVIDIEFNDVNGGSFSITACLKDAHYPEYLGLHDLLDKERVFDELKPYEDFAKRVNDACYALKNFVNQSISNGEKVACLGASTKGNVLLQYCRFTAKEIFAVAEVNSDKFGTYTPGTLIPILPDEEVISKADYLIVLPWHFKDFLIQKYHYCRHKLVFPLPTLQISP